jgi:hypothetical protein
LTGEGSELNSRVVIKVATAATSLVLVMVALLSAASATPAASTDSTQVREAAALGPVSHTYRLARGVKLTTIRYPNVPNEVRIIEVIPSRGPSLDPAVGSWQWPLWGKTSSMAAANDAIAAVNGDFSRGYGSTKHISMIDGELWTTGSQPGPAFGFSEDGTRAFVGFPQLDMKLTGANGTTLVNVQEWNGGYPTGGANGYTVRGERGSPPPGVANPSGSDPRFCAARLRPIKSSGFEWSGAGRRSIVRRYRVAEQPDVCEKTPLPLGSDRYNVVLAAHEDTEAATKIRALEEGQRVKMRWTLSGWPGVADVIGTMPMLVNNRENVGVPYEEGGDAILWFNPRTTVGVTKGCIDWDTATLCKIYLVTVDGRQASSGWSKGMKFPEISDELLQLNVWDAANLDGGGSTTMWVKRRNEAYCTYRPPAGGCLANDPSYSMADERTITNVLSVLAGADPGTPAGLD